MVMVEAVILENVVAEVMVVIRTAGMTEKWELLQRNLLKATDRLVIGPIVTLSLGGRKRRHQCCYHR